MNKLNCIKHDFLIIKNLWDLHCIHSDNFDSIDRVIQLEEMFKDAIKVIKYKNKKKKPNIKLKFEGESFVTKGDFERIYLVIC